MTKPRALPSEWRLEPGQVTVDAGLRDLVSQP